MLAEQEDQGLCFRVFVQPGGCDGFSYGMTWDAPGEDDEVIERGGVRLLIDKTGSRVLAGGGVGQVTPGAGSGFWSRKPNAGSTRRCRHFFKAARRARPGRG